MLLASALLLGCSDLFGPSLPEGRVPLDPLPAEYEAWWSIVEKCSGERADLRAVEWWTLPGEETIPGTDGALGVYYDPSHQIVLAGGRVREGFIVRHEMLHALLSGTKVGSGHPREYFESRCGGLVGCGGDCLDEIGGRPPEGATAPVAAAGDVEVVVHAFPRVFRRSQESWGCSTFVVEARNVSDRAVRMDVSRGLPFGWRIVGLGGGGGGGPLPPNDFVLLRPGAARSYAYDCPDRVTLLAPGTYALQGEWEGVLSDPIRLEILP